MSTRGLRERVMSSARAPVDPGEASIVVEAFFDALGHFAGEPPSIDDLARVIAPDASILDGVGDNEEGLVCYARDAWLAHIAEISAQHETASRGQFFEEVQRTMTDCAPDVHVGSVVEERLTQGSDSELADTLDCALVVGRVGDQTSIVHVRVRRSSRPPPR